MDGGIRWCHSPKHRSDACTSLLSECPPETRAGKGRTATSKCNEVSRPPRETVRVTVGRLRRKLGDPPLIETVHRQGYRL
jgi:hypothetical protein